MYNIWGRGHNLGSGDQKLQKFGPDIFLTIHFIVSILPSAELKRLNVSGLEEWNRHAVLITTLSFQLFIWEYILPLFSNWVGNLCFMPDVRILDFCPRGEINGVKCQIWGWHFETLNECLGWSCLQGICIQSRKIFYTCFKVVGSRSR